MMRSLFAVVVAVVTALPVHAGPKLLLTVASYRERGKYPTITFYEHDGKANGKIIGTIPTEKKRSDSHPSLSLDGRYCAFASEQENQTSKIFLWDRETSKRITLPKLNDSPNALLHPTISGDGKLLALAAWNRPKVSQRWDVQFYDVPGKKFMDVPDVNTQDFDERMPCLCQSGRFVAYVSNAKGGRLTDVRLYDRVAKKAIDLSRMNAAGLDWQPSISGDGNLIAFSSDRRGGKGGRDIYLYDRSKSAFVPLAGLNSAAHEQSPALSADGRYITFVSERIAGQGERDVFLYDVTAKRLLPTPGLNSPNEDIDPCVIVLP